MVRKPNCACVVCEVAVYRRPVHIATGNVYCSQRCCGMHQRVPRVCPVCKKTYTGLKRTCSRACANESRAGIIYTGENKANKAYQGIALKQELARLRKGQCEKCGEENYAILQVHHKKERARGGTDDLINLELLCPNCHAAHHLGFNLFLESKNARVLPRRK